MYSKSQYKEIIKEKKKPKEDITTLEAIRAAPQMEILTGSDEWDKYLSYLEPIALQAEQSIKDIQQQLMSPTLFDSEKLFYLKSESIKMTERAQVIRTLMTFPKDIIRFGKLKSNPYKDET